MFTHLRLRTCQYVEKKKFPREASLEDRYRQERLCTHPHGSRQTELDKDIAFDLGLLRDRILRVGRRAISFPISIKLHSFTQ